MLSAMKRFSCVGLLLTLTTWDAGAQQRDCFTVVMNHSTGGGSLGAILLDRCTGNSWILARTRLSNGRDTTNRWFPLTVEKTEAVTGAAPGSQ